MNITHDKKIDAQYISLKKGKIAYTKKETDWLFFDCAKNGDILGIEILNASNNPLPLSALKGFLEHKVV